MRFTVYTLFPGLIESYLGEALLARARNAGIVDVVTRDLRRFAGNRTGRVDDAPYGGGAGMVMRVDVAAAALAEARSDEPPPTTTILLSPAGEPLDQDMVARLASHEHVLLLSGRYEGFDARVEDLVDHEVSLGDFVLMGGELPALALIEAVTRLLPGALGDADSHRQESFTTGLLDYPEYTRPPVFQGAEVPETLLSGHHGKVNQWRRISALRRTFERRPDLLASAQLSEEELALVDSWTRNAEASLDGAPGSARPVESPSDEPPQDESPPDEPPQDEPLPDEPLPDGSLPDGSPRTKAPQDEDAGPD